MNDYALTWCGNLIDEMSAEDLRAALRRASSLLLRESTAKYERQAIEDSVFQITMSSAYGERPA